MKCRHIHLSPSAPLLPLLPYPFGVSFRAAIPKYTINYAQVLILSNQSRNNIQQVMQIFGDAGGQMIDVSPLYGMSEANVGEFAQKLGSI